MKQIEDIENMAWQELESAAMQENAPLPEDFGKRLAETLAAKIVTEEAVPRRPVRRILWTALAAAAAAAAILALPTSGGEPKDTFEDPSLAYAEVERTFQLISQKMSEGLSLAGEAKSLAERPVQILQNNRK